MKQTWTKAVTAFGLTFGAALGTALQSGTITAKEAMIALGSALIVGVGTWGATNKETIAPSKPAGDLDAEAAAYREEAA